MNTAAPLQTAIAYQAASQHERALEVLRPYLSEHPDDIEALRLATRSELHAGRPTVSLSMADAILRAEPGDPIGFELRAWSQFELGRRDLAGRSAREAARLAPDDWHRWADLALIGAGANDFGRDIVAAGRRARELAPQEPRAIVAHGAALSGGNQRAAATAYREALRIDPEHRLARNYLAMLNAKRGRTASSLGELIRLSRERPDDQRIRRNMVFALHRGNWAVGTFTIIFGIGLGMGMAAEPPLSSFVPLIAAVPLVIEVVSAASLIGTLRGRFRAIAALLGRERPLMFAAFGLVLVGAVLVLVAGLGPRGQLESNAMYGATAAVAGCLVGALALRGGRR